MASARANPGWHPPIPLLAMPGNNYFDNGWHTIVDFSKYVGKESFLKTRVLNMNYGRQSTVAPCCRARTPPRSRLPTPPQLLHPANLPHSCQQSGKITLYTREGTRDIVTNNRQGEPQPIEGDKSITKWEQKVRTIDV